MNEPAITGADAPASTPAPVKIAPIPDKVTIKLPGVPTRGYSQNVPEVDLKNEPKPGDETKTPEEIAAEEAAKKAKPAQTQEPIKAFGKTFKTYQDALKYGERINTTARNAQSTADSQRLEMERRLRALEERNTTPTSTQPNGGDLIQLDPEVKEFYQQAHRGLLEANNIEDPSERAKNVLIITQAIAQQVANEAREEILKELKSRINPFEEQQAEYQEVQRASGLFKEVANESEDGSTPSYPELNNRADLEAIASVWRSYRDNGMPDSMLYHPDQLKMIVLAYRQHRAQSATPKQAAAEMKTDAGLPATPPRPAGPAYPAGAPAPKPKTPPVTSGGTLMPPSFKPTTIARRLTPGQNIPGVFIRGQQ